MTGPGGMRRPVPHHEESHEDRRDEGDGVALEAAVRNTRIKMLSRLLPVGPVAALSCLSSTHLFER